MMKIWLLNQGMQSERFLLVRNGFTVFFNIKFTDVNRPLKKPDYSESGADISSFSQIQ